MEMQNADLILCVTDIMVIELSGMQIALKSFA